MLFEEALAVNRLRFTRISCKTTQRALYAGRLCCSVSSGAVAKNCDEHVCMSVCPRAYLRNQMCDLYQFFCACCLWPWLGPHSACDEIPRERGTLGGRLSGPFKSIGNLLCSRRCCVRCRMGHSIANNVMQQKGSFSMPGKRK